MADCSGVNVNPVQMVKDSGHVTQYLVLGSGPDRELQARGQARMA